MFKSICCRKFKWTNDFPLNSSVVFYFRKSQSKQTTLDLPRACLVVVNASSIVVNVFICNDVMCILRKNECNHQVNLYLFAYEVNSVPKRMY